MRPLGQAVWCLKGGEVIMFAAARWLIVRVTHGIETPYVIGRSELTLLSLGDPTSIPGTTITILKHADDVIDRIDL